jgi:nucleoside-diphosphate-sugar epimerase
VVKEPRSLTYPSAEDLSVTDLGPLPEKSQIKSNDVLYFISTVDNYNVHTDPYIDIDTNLTTLIRVLESYPKDKAKDLTFNFISSWFVYGSVELPAKEDSLCNPKGFYSITKRTAEQLLISYCETFGINYRILRLSNILGPQDRKVSKKKNALQYMLNQVKNDETVTLYDGGDIYRDYLFVDDAVQAINLVLEKGKLNQIYNIGSGVPSWLFQIIDLAVKKTNSKSKIEYIETANFHKIVQTKDMVLDISKLKSLGFEAKYDMDKILDILSRE